MKYMLIYLWNIFGGSILEIKTKVDIKMSVKVYL